ncbi:cytochrome c maturation protein CcmE [Paenibacillus athensensis]|uniref:Cytochrome c-type biogenesis protein CcmE n=1 Tax=Paenibacillus athensensis TaxID=1967502 RepID=A0A4Y8Q201_9BACL|nr:cytochrome c maturation protein CcmE [Paenibacillus athensensis]MCD1261052.1 cytochrome c maturation protein CcmE [Paenibacillus athensensis]
MKKNKKILFAVIPLVVVIALLIAANTTNSSSQEVTLDKVIAAPDKYKEKLITVQGDLQESTVNWDATSTLLRFQIKQDDRTIDVEYKGVKPDTFSDGTIVMADGVYDAGRGMLVAERLRTRCPSKYESLDKEANKEAYEKQHMKKE